MTKHTRNILLLFFSIFALTTFTSKADTCSVTSPVMQQQTERRDARIAVVLPFGSPTAEGARSLEFYRGMLLAADDMKVAGYNATITAINEQTAETDISAELTRLCQTNDVVTGFAYRSHMIAAGEVARQQGCLAAFPMATYIPFDLTSNSSCVFTLASDEKFIELYAHMLFSCFGKCNVVYVKSAEPRFTADVLDLLTLLRRKGCKYKTIELREAVDNLGAVLNAKKANIIITDTNDTASIFKIKSAIASLQSRQPAMNIALAGTQQWMEILPQITDETNAIDVYIPTMWYQNNSLLAIDALKQKYTQCFHCDPSAVQPSAMLQGYDFARIAIAGLAHYGRNFVQHKPLTQQLLTVCNFFAIRGNSSTDAPTSCWTNTGLRLLHVKPNGSKELIDLQPGK